MCELTTQNLQFLVDPANFHDTAIEIDLSIDLLCFHYPHQNRVHKMEPIPNHHPDHSIDSVRQEQLLTG